MYSNNILNFQESTTILNACTKKVWRSIQYTTYHLFLVFCSIPRNHLFYLTMSTLVIVSFYCERNCCVIAGLCLEISEFELHLHYYIHFWTNTFGKCMKAINLSALGQIVSLLFLHMDGFSTK